MPPSSLMIYDCFHIYICAILKKCWRAVYGLFYFYTFIFPFFFGPIIFLLWGFTWHRETWEKIDRRGFILGRQFPALFKEEDFYNDSKRCVRNSLNICWVIFVVNVCGQDFASSCYLLHECNSPCYSPVIVFHLQT